MRMRDVLQLLKNLGTNVTIKMSGTMWLPSIELSGKGILDLHANSIWVANLIGDGFLKSRIMWQDSAHEFRFISPDNRGTACRDALVKVATALQDARGKVTGQTSAEFAIIDLIVAVESNISVAAKNVIESRDNHNRWVREIGGEAGEKMTESEHLASLVETIRNVRRDTYPMWYSLIDLLPDGATKGQAEQNLRNGCKTVGLDTEEITPDWQVLPVHNS